VDRNTGESMSAYELKKLAAQVRRTDTALRHLASRLNLNDGDKAVLLKAAAVLSENGRKVGKQASKVKRDEDARDKAVAKAEQEAKAMIANWPATTTLDKVAICIANQMESNLLHDLQSESRYATEPRLLDGTGATRDTNQRGLAFCP
jgi:hypothetical protein